MPLFDTSKKSFYYPILFLLFLISGFCGLAYQVIWIRLAFSAFGVITPVLSVVVSVFMLGIALGSWAGGKYIRELKARTGLSAILFYAIAELLIGVGSIVVPKLFNIGQALLLSAGAFDSTAYLLFSAAIIAISIIPWCTFMGCTIPFAMEFARERDNANTTSFSYLYLANVIGAVIGTAATALFLIELAGFHRTLMTAGTFNFFIASAAIILNFLYRDKIGCLAGHAKPAGGISGPTIRKGLTPLILFTTGFVAMSMEVIWTRAFTPVLKTTVYSFASILTVYLAATCLGSSLYRVHVKKNCVISAPIIISRLAYFGLIPILFNDPRVLFWLGPVKIFAVLGSIMPFCAALGYLTPKLIDEFSQGNPKAAGNVYALNTIGCILGPVTAAYLFLPMFGVRLSLVLLAVPLAIFFIYYFKGLLKKNFRDAILNSLVTAALFISSTNVLLCYEDGIFYRSGIVRRDYAATVISAGSGMRKALLVNGIGMTKLTTITKCMVHLPLAIRDSPPGSALVICLGMGTTFRSVALWNINATAVELVPGVRDAFGFYFSDADEILKKPGAGIVVDDGRRFLKRTDDRFDVIAIDPPPPIESAGSSLLYSEEFYRLLKARLKKGGVLSQWAPGGEKMIIEAMAKAIRAEFPYVRVFRSIEGWGFHFFASEEPFDMPSPDEFASRLPRSAEKDLLEWEPKYSAKELYKRILSNEVSIEKILVPSVTYSITDDRPFNEYFLFRRFKALVSRSYQLAY